MRVRISSLVLDKACCFPWRVGGLLNRYVCVQFSPARQCVGVPGTTEALTLWKKVRLLSRVPRCSHSEGYFGKNRHPLNSISPSNGTVALRQSTTLLTSGSGFDSLWFHDRSSHLSRQVRADVLRVARRNPLFLLTTRKRLWWGKQPDVLFLDGFDSLLRDQRKALWWGACFGYVARSCAFSHTNCVSTSKCFKCKLTLPTSEFSIRPNGKPTSYCKTCQRSASKAHYQANKTAHNQRRWASIIKYRDNVTSHVIKIKEGSPCVDCHEYHPYWAMDFDHRDPANKEFCIGQAVNFGYSLSRVDAEIAKCDLVCALCHRYRTYGQRRNFRVVAKR